MLSTDFYAVDFPSYIALKRLSHITRDFREKKSSQDQIDDFLHRRKAAIIWAWRGTHLSFSLGVGPAQCWVEGGLSWAPF